MILLVGNNSNLEIFNRIKETNSNNADEYSNSKTYVKDEYCIYNNTLYKANQAIDTAEEFTESHWTETTVGTELKSQADSISALNSRMESIPSNDNFISLNFETGQVNIVNDNTYDIPYDLSDYSSANYMILGMYALGYLEYYGAWILNPPYLGRTGTAKVRAYSASPAGAFPNGALSIRLILLKKS